MSITYTPTTNFGAKDSLPTNDPDKVIKGSEFTTEFTAIQTAFNQAAPTASPTFTGTVTIASVDINGGNIDGTAIGANSASTGAFTTVTADNAEIGTGGASNANAIIDLTGDTTYTDFGFRIIRNSGANGRTDLRHRGTGNLTIEAVEAAAITFETSDTERMRITSGGNVGIGTQSPSAKLEIEDDDFARLDLNLANATGTTIADVRGLVEGAEKWRLGKTSSASDDFTINVGATERMRIDSSGNLDLGTTASADRYQNIIATSARLSFNAGTGFTGSAATSIYNQSAIPLVFGTNNSERARLDASGNLLVGRTSVGTSGTGHSIRGGDSAVFAREGGEVLIIARNTNNGQAVRFDCQGTNGVGSIDVTTSATTYNTSSDARLKENIADAESASELIDAIQVRSFDWKADGSHQRYGMVAQELLEVAPEAVSQPEDPEAMMGVDYSKLVPMLVKEIQSLRARVAQLEGA